MSRFWQFFYSRLQAVRQPVFRLVELQVFEKAEWEPLTVSGVLQRTAEPESILTDRGTELAVRKSGDQIYGVDESGELPAITVLRSEDLIQFKVNLSALLASLREVNGLYGRGIREEHGFILAGTRTFAGHGKVSVYFSTGEVDHARLEERLSLLSTGTGVRIAVLPGCPDLDRLAALYERDLHLAELDRGSRIAWPAELVDPREAEPPYAMIEEGSTWRLRFDGEERTIKGSKGLSHIAMLVKHAGAVLSPFNLEKREAPRVGRIDLSKAVETFGEFGDDGDRLFSVADGAYAQTATMDPQKARAYLPKIREYDAAIDEAREAGREVEVAEITEARAELIAEIMGAVSSGPRNTSADLNRARDRVSKAIERAFPVIEEKFPEAGEHLRINISCGNSFMYKRPPDEAWRVDFL